MSLAVLEDITLYFGSKRIMECLDLRIAEGDRIGLIGPNGSGKSTLLRLLSGEQQADGGKITLAKGMRLGYLPQDVSIEGGRSLIRFVLDAVPGRTELEEEIATVERQLGEFDPETQLEELMEASERIGHLHERLAHFEADYSEHKATQILAGLGFKTDDLMRDVGEFSGGWKMRAVLTSLLFQKPDLLMMDEPTNHLDMPSVAWLSDFLKAYRAAFILISHDREFLNEQIDRVVSYESEGVRLYKGDLDAYAKQRAEEREILENRARNVARQREQLERFVTRFKAKASKAAQAQSKLKQLEKLEVVELPEERQTIRFRFAKQIQPGRSVLEAETLAKSYGEHQVLRGVDLRVQRGDRIALLGVNGAGKTTLLRILAGEIEATGGEYKYGHNVKVGYYAQHHADTLRKTDSVYDAVKYAAKDIPHQQVRAALGAMLFGDEEIEKPVSVLSGGERARVALSQLLVDPGNLLLMDEPTNHLDLQSSERLAEALDDYDGTLLFVSHNRSFIRHLAKTLWFVEDGKVVVYPGTLDDYLASCRLEEKAPQAAAVSDANQAKRGSDGKTKSKKPKRDASKGSTPNTKALSKEEKRKRRALERRSADLEKRIAKLESEQAAREAKLAKPEIYENADEHRKVTAEFARAQAELEVAMESWAEVSEELESP